MLRDAADRNKTRKRTRAAARRLVVLLSLALIGAAAASSGGNVKPGGVGITCNVTTSEGERDWRVMGRPAACMILPPRASFADGANLSGLHWSTWGGVTATATGIEKGFHLPYSWIRVQVVAYRLRRDRCETRYRLYTRLRLTSKYGTKVVRAMDCLGA